MHVDRMCVLAAYLSKLVHSSRQLNPVPRLGINLFSSLHGTFMEWGQPSLRKINRNLLVVLQIMRKQFLDMLVYSRVLSSCGCLSNNILYSKGGVVMFEIVLQVKVGILHKPYVGRLIWLIFIPCIIHMYQSDPGNGRVQHGIT